MLDPENEHVHKISNPTDAARIRRGQKVRVTANCGKSWVPTKLEEETKGMPKCPDCFPPREPCWAA